MLPSQIEQAVALLRNDDVVCIPTETVYGLAASLYSEKAIDKIYSLKGRPRTNPLIVHIGRKEDLYNLCTEVPAPLQRLIDCFWPGPLTILVEKSNQVPSTVTAGGSRVGIRMPDHPLTLELLQALSFPLVAPSANPYNAISPTTAKHVHDYFGTQVPLILDGGPCRQGLESTVVGMENGQVAIYRQGMITAEEIQAIVGHVVDLSGSAQNATVIIVNDNPEIINEVDKAQVAPGMTLKHYSPKTPTLFCENIDRYKEDCDDKAFLVFCKKHSDLPLAHQYVLSEKGDLNEAAARLYQVLHEIDERSYRQIICERLPDHGIGRAINDRLLRAGGGIISQ
ncbi:MAG: L-threonylcarbamoyladenylate synthase [Sphingomonadales bacterium]